MTDNVKDGLNVDQVSKDLAGPGTPKSAISQDNGQGLGENLNLIAVTPNSSRRAIGGEEGPKKPPSQSRTFRMYSVGDEET